MATIAQQRPRALRLTPVLVRDDPTRVHVAYVTEARATELYLAGVITLQEGDGRDGRDAGDFVYVLTGETLR